MDFLIKVDSVVGVVKLVLFCFRCLYFVKKILKNGWLGYDEKIKVKDKFWVLNYFDLEFVVEIFNNEIVYRLFIVYVSLSWDEKYVLDCEKLVWDLGGIVYVFCEFLRKFFV